MDHDAAFAREQSRSARIRTGLLAIVALTVLAGLNWANDRVTLQGERTVYTVDCADGVWQGSRCSGKLVPGPRYRFRALKAHGEVVFWTVGAREPSGKLADCVIADGRNWACKPGADARRTITLRMSHGYPVQDPDGPTEPFHAVPKWRWGLLRYGVALGKEVRG